MLLYPTSIIICGEKLRTPPTCIVTETDERAAFVSYIETNLKATEGALGGESDTPANGGPIFGLVGGDKPPTKTGFQRSHVQVVGYAGSG
jgi:hypothetical protein